MSQTMRDRVQDYLDRRRKAGCQMRTEGYLLLKFADYADSSGHQGPLTIDLALCWARLPTDSSALYQAKRLEMVTCFAKYQAAIEPETQVPPRGLLGPAHCRTQPYIYTSDEIAKLMKAAHDLTPQDGLRPQTVVTVVGLLACTGMRPSEALQLECEDVDLENAVIKVRQGKFRKSRLVALHPSAVCKLSEYASLRNRLLPKVQSRAFFLTDSGVPFNYRMLSQTFQTLRRCLGETVAPGSRQPRLYDLRHRFACERLLAWYREGAEVDQKIGALSTYMGHVKVTDTYWYVSAVPPLLEAAVQRFEQFATPHEGAQS